MCIIEEKAAESGLDEMRSECRSTSPLPKEAAASVAPWLVFPYGEGKQNQAFYNIFESNSNSRKTIPELSGKTFWQKPSHQGWLIILCNDKRVDYSHQGWNYGDCFLWNPESFESIQLPNLLHWIEEYDLKDCVLSLPPNSDNESDSMVLFLFSPIREETKPLEFVLFLFCHPGDEQWRMKRFYGDEGDLSGDDNRGELWDIEYLQCFKGKLYVMSFDNPQLEISLGDDNVTLSLRSFDVGDNTFFHSVGHISSESFYVESSDEFLRIDMYFGVRGYRKGVVTVNVMRLDFSLMEWSVVDSFGDHVLFISENTRACCSSADLGFTHGCLYYTLPEDQSLYKFEIESNGDSVILPCVKLATPWFSPNWIMMPNDRRRRRIDEYSLAKAERDRIVIAIENDLRRINNDKNETLEEKQDAGEIDEAIPWDSLDLDMVGLIINYLHPLDYVHFRLVCRANRAMMPLVKPAWSSTASTHLSPWLVFSRDNKYTTYKFTNPMQNNENYLMKFSELLQGATIRFQKGGWLLMSTVGTTLFFYNPFTKEIIRLPDLPWPYHLSGICFSTSPTSVDCIVFAIQQCGDRIRIWLLIGDTESWDILSFDNRNTGVYIPSHNTPIYYKGSFYSVDYNGNLGVFNFDVENPEDTWNVFAQPSEHFNDEYASFLVECGGDLLLVKLGHLNGLVKVFKLDLTGMQWVEVDSLGKHMLFISCTSCCSVVAPDSRMENKIYFPRLCLNGEGILFYSLDTGSYHSDWSCHTTNNLYGTEGWHRNCTWIEPNWSKSAGQ